MSDRFTITVGQRTFVCSEGRWSELTPDRTTSTISMLTHA
jgi:hypothetical protein